MYGMCLVETVLASIYFKETIVFFTEITTAVLFVLFFLLSVFLFQAGTKIKKPLYKVSIQKGGCESAFQRLEITLLSLPGKT